MFVIKTGREAPLEAVHAAMEEAFSDYFVDVHLELDGFRAMIARESISISDSVLLFEEEALFGVGLLARREGAARVAAMGVVPRGRSRGAGRMILQELERNAAAGQDRSIELEVITQNLPALGLYRSAGYETLRRLVGFRGELQARGEAETLDEISLEEAADRVLREGYAHLPWQVSGASLRELKGCRAFALDGAALVLIVQESGPVVLRGLVVEGALRRQGRARRLLHAAAARFPGRTWQVPALFPEEMESFFLSMGFKRAEISQLQMRKILIPDIPAGRERPA